MILPPEPESSPGPTPESGAGETTRDRLAADRTAMANERTFLAYVRTSLALILTGVSAIHLPGLHPRLAFGESLYYVFGGGFIVCGLVVLVIGYVRYRRFGARVREAGLGPHS